MQTVFLERTLGKQTLDALFVIVTRLSGREVGAGIVQGLMLNVKKVFVSCESVRGLLRHRLRCEEILDEATRVCIEEVLNPLVAR